MSVSDKIKKNLSKKLRWKKSLLEINHLLNGGGEKKKETKD